MYDPRYQEDYQDVDADALPSLRTYTDYELEENEQEAEIPSYILPTQVKDFLVYFRRNLNSGNTFEIESIYDNHFRGLTEKFFKDQPWPSSEIIAPFVDKDALFLTLYRELYFRHIYSNLQPTLEHRFESYENYCDLFNFILDSEKPVTLELPNRWLWDIIDEFIYQFQSFTQYRAKLSARSADELANFRSNPGVWNVHIVLNVLHSLINKSNITKQLKPTEGESSEPDEFGSKNLYKMLGYFSLVGLLRLHTLLGDYHQALQVMENIELNKKGLYSGVPACQITVYYYIGFAYLMMRRYQDAVRSFANILYYILKTQSFHQRSAGYDMLIKKRDQLFNLLAIAMTLCPQRIDDGVHQQLTEKCGERIQRVQRGDMAAFEELFQYGCPKFISPVPPNYDDPSKNYQSEPYDLQIKVFMQEIKQQTLLPTIRSYLKLYSTMPIAKLASFLDVDAETFRIQLHNYKHKTNQLVWSSGAALDGTRVPSDDVDFYINGDMIHIADVKVARCFGEYFIHQITKMNSPRNLK